MRLSLHYGDIGSSGNLSDLIRQVQPDEIYHLAAQSHVRVSFDLPDYTGDVTGLSTMNWLALPPLVKADASSKNATMVGIGGRIKL